MSHRLTSRRWTVLSLLLVLAMLLSGCEAFVRAPPASARREARQDRRDTRLFPFALWVSRRKR